MKTLNPNDLGRKYLVEECQKIQIEDYLKICRNKIKELIISSELETLGLKIELTTSNTHYNGIRLWFKCPLCDKRIGILYKHPVINKIGCRSCLNLEYRKTRYKGMIENNLLDN